MPVHDPFGLSRYRRPNIRAGCCESLAMYFGTEAVAGGVDRLRRYGSDRNRKEEAAALGPLAGHPDIAALSSHQILGNVQPES